MKQVDMLLGLLGIASLSWGLIVAYAASMRETRLRREDATLLYVKSIWCIALSAALFALRG
jgi:hypothetical protein